ncbi:elongation factor P [Candidatus Woesebacteria bacterium]|nr:elongation factor P [Candidatus Woesebacteria bacterium]
MISATDLKNGKTFKMDGEAYKVHKYTHQKLGRGGASVKLELINLKTGVKSHKTVNSTVKVEEIDTVKRPLQYLFKDNDAVTFMDADTYEQVEIPLSLVEDEIQYIKEGQTVDIMFVENEAVSIDIAPKVTLKVVDTVPGVKGDTASNVYKPAKLENGLTVKVPLFIKEGEKVSVDTRTGEYVERVKS